ncbi:hypothetical protein HanIR_Chr09g0409601 [Helianthus annuus]|nr:hypothetical protein HanIR_Chr09g0409601 [Helianthus annuus]
MLYVIYIYIYVCGGRNRYCSKHSQTKELQSFRRPKKKAYFSLPPHNEKAIRFQTIIRSWRSISLSLSLSLSLSHTHTHTHIYIIYIYTCKSVL